MATGTKMTIGKRYPVPCVELATDLYGLRAGQFIPVIGPCHEDKAIIGFADEHWHIDWRFAGKKFWAYHTDGYYCDAKVHAVVISQKYTDGVTHIKRMRMRREMPTFPHEIPVNADWIHVPWLAKLEDAYAEHEIKLDCVTCPHRGVPLNDMPQKDGIVVCPGHGLAWDMTTGKLHRRTSIAASR